MINYYRVKYNPNNTSILSDYYSSYNFELILVGCYKFFVVTPNYSVNNKRRKIIKLYFRKPQLFKCLFYAHLNFM